MTKTVFTHDVLVTIFVYEDGDFVDFKSEVGKSGHEGMINICLKI